jgi:hypothetical protein
MKYIIIDQKTGRIKCTYYSEEGYDLVGLDCEEITLKQGEQVIIYSRDLYELQISQVSQKVDETCQDAVDYAIRGGDI